MTLHATYTAFYEMPPQLVEGSVRTWIARGANFVVVYSTLPAGARLERKDNPDEHMLYLPKVKGTIRAGSEAIARSGSVRLNGTWHWIHDDVPT